MGDLSVLQPETIRDKDCKACELWGTANEIGIIAEGQPGGALFVGIGPGHREDKTGRPFTGKSGRRLRLIVGNTGLAAAYANLVGCIPLDDRPTEEQAKACLGKRILDLIDHYKPKCIVALGGFAGEFLLKGTLHRQKNKVVIGRSRGLLFKYGEIPLVITYHPAFTMRETNRNAHRDLRQDIAWVKRVVDGEVSSEEAEFTPKRDSTTLGGSSWVVDIETTHLRPWSGEITKVGIADAEDLSSPCLLKGPLPPLGNREIQGWNFTFDSQWLPDEVFKVPWMDGMVLHGILEPDASTRTLKVVGPQITGVPYLKTLADPMDEEEFDYYICLDLYQTGEAVKYLRKKAETHPARKCIPFVMKLTRALAQMSKWGCKIDHSVCMARAKAYQVEQEVVVREMRGVAEEVGFFLEFKPKGYTFTRSTKRILELVYDRLGMPPIRTGEGNLSLDKMARLQLAPEDAFGFLESYGKFLHSQKMVQTYILPLLEGGLVDPQGFAHPIPNVVKREKENSGDGGGGTVTGRVVWKDPSFQVYPSEDRGVVCSRHRGGIIAGLDLSQIEPRVFAWRTQEPKLIELLQRGEDFYRGIMSLILKTEPDQITKDLRRAGKTIYLAIMYGAGADKIQKVFKMEAGLDVPEDTCQELIDSRQETLPKVMEYIEMIRQKVMEGVYLTSPSGRARVFPLSEDHEILRQAVNWETQSFASDINHAICLELMGLKRVQPIMTVHDENTVDIEGDKVPGSIVAVYEEIPYIIRKHFGVDFTVPVKYGIKSGSHWS